MYQTKMLTKITREVEKSERIVKQLENAYKNLERAVDKSMGKAEMLS